MTVRRLFRHPSGRLRSLFHGAFPPRWRFESTLPNPTRQGSSRFLQQSCDPVRPVWYLATKETVGNLEECASVVEGKPLLPPSRDVGEVLLGELPRRRVRPLSRYRKQSRHGGETREKVGGV